MRRLLGWLLVVLGVMLAATGAVGAVMFGPDDAVDSATVRVDSAGAAIVTGREAIRYAGPTLRLTVMSPNGPVFVGVGSQVDVEDFVSDVSRTRIDEIDLSSSVQVSEVGGSLDSLAVGPDLDWWLESASGERAEVEFALPDMPISVVVMNVDGASSVVVDMRAAVIIPGAFWGAIAVIVLGVGLLILGVVTLRRGRRARKSDPVEAGEGT